VVTEVDTIVEGHEEGVGIPTAQVSNEYESHISRGLQFPDYRRPIILFSKMEGMVTQT
jgi:hypothetical protein